MISRNFVGGRMVALTAHAHAARRPTSGTPPRLPTCSTAPGSAGHPRTSIPWCNRAWPRACVIWSTDRPTPAPGGARRPGAQPQVTAGRGRSRLRTELTGVAAGDDARREAAAGARSSARHRRDAGGTHPRPGCLVDGPDAAVRRSAGREDDACSGTGTSPPARRKSRTRIFSSGRTRRSASRRAGNFGVLVKAMSRDPAMIDWLDLKQSRAAHPNENFAREVMELFTLGEGQLHRAGRDRGREGVHGIPDQSAQRGVRSSIFASTTTRRRRFLGRERTCATATRPSTRSWRNRRARGSWRASCGRSSLTTTRPRRW